MIPKLHYISEGKSPKEHLENVQKACNSGAELVQLSFKNIAEKKIEALAKEAREITSHFQTRLILNGYYKIARVIKADGVHLEPTDACPTAARKHIYTWQTIGATAHTLEDCQTLITKQVDYISLGPFKLEETERAPLGLPGYSLIIQALQTETPILGVGNISLEDVTAILETGVSGIVVSQAITQDFNAIKTFNELLKASSTQEQRHTFE